MAGIADERPRIWLRRLPERHVASARATCQRHRVRRTVAALHELVMDAVGLQGLAPAGPLFTRYHSVGSKVELEAGIPLAQPIRAQGQVRASTLPGGPALCTVYAGKTADKHLAVRALRSFCSRAGLTQTGGYWESYLIHPPDGEDFCDCEIAIYLPVARIRSDGREPVVEATGNGARPRPQAEVELATEPDRSGLSLRSLPVPRGPRWGAPGDERGIAVVCVRVDRPVPGRGDGASLAERPLQTPRTGA
jgi:effector-binding domain-containing protein